MENASKALIIAGAILLAILIISMGIIIYRQASGVIDSNAMDEVAVTSFNEKFLKYEGNNVRGANVNALINTIIQNNLTNEGDESKQVKVDCSAADWNIAQGETKYNGTAPTTKQGSAKTGKSYIVKCTEDSKSGYVTTVTISNANK